MTTPENYADGVAAEVRAEMARQGKTQRDLAAALGINAATAGGRCAGRTPFDVIELMKVALWLGVPIGQLTSPSRTAAAS